MKKIFCSTVALLTLSALISACGGGGNGGYSPPPPPPPPPPPVDQNPAGEWFGQMVTASAPDVFTSFEFDRTGPFSVGTTPYRATFSDGVAESRGVRAFYRSGDFSWHVLAGPTATVTFETNPSSVNFYVRLTDAGVSSEIRIYDENGMLIRPITPTLDWVLITETRNATQTLIGSIEVENFAGGVAGDVIIDDWTYGFASSSDDIGCLVAETMEFVCIVNDGTISNPIAGAEGTIQIANGNQVSGSGNLHAVPGAMLADESTVSALTITAGTVSEGATLNLTLAAAGTTLTLTMAYDTDYDRGSDLATVADVYMTFDIYGDASSFEVDGSGVIFGQSNAGCVLNGQVTIIDATGNAYDVALDLTSCGALNGSYNGLGQTGDSGGTDDQFIFAVFTASGTVIAEALK